MTIKLCAAATSILLLLSSTIARAQPAKLAELLAPILAKHANTPALFGAIVDHGQLVALGSAGVRKRGTTVPVTDGDLIHLGSDTKAMTANLIGQLIDARQLALNTTMADVFPELNVSMNADMRGVTIEQLLRHRAGLPPNLKWNDFAATKQPLVEQRLAVVKQALAAAPASPPGKAFVYSNLGYTILGAVLEKKTGKPWEDLITEKLFAPLGMTSAGFGPPGTPGQTDQPWGHGKGPISSPSQFDNPPVMSPAGRVHCTMQDWAKFIAQYSGPAAGTTKLLSDQTLTALTTPAPGADYAGGWLVVSRPWAGGRALSHDGSNTFWYCSVWIAPIKGFAVLAAANSGDDDAKAACQEAIGALLAQRDKR